MKKNSSVGSTKSFITWRYSAEHKRIEWTTTRLPKVPAHYGHFFKNQSINSETIFAWASKSHHIRLTLIGMGYESKKNVYFSTT